MACKYVTTPTSQTRHKKHLVSVTIIPIMIEACPQGCPLLSHAAIPVPVQAGSRGTSAAASPRDGAASRAAFAPARPHDSGASSAAAFVLCKLVLM